jgi:proteasome accessory factor A
MAMNVLFGLESEIGITRAQHVEDLDVVAESIALVRAARHSGVRMRWDYSLEDPHVDARGFRVRELRQDTDEANYFARDSARELSFSEIKSDLALKNGARYYNDHAHPEYCTPECSTLLELLRQDHAGDQLLMACRQARNEELDNPVVLYKNNTDFQGHSYGCHENYLIPRALPWENLAQAMTAFLVTRQIFTGAGKFGWEAEDRFLQPGFQISQRADFFTVLQSVDTMQRRPIVNTRDEPHANEKLYRRFHVIIGDANLSPYANWLKVGTTALVLEAIAQAGGRCSGPTLKDPIEALKSISRDPSWSWECQLVNGEASKAVDVQRAYLAFTREVLPAPGGDWEQLRSAWEEILDDLENDPLLTSNRLDWSAKYELIEGFRQGEAIAHDDPWLQSLDLSYHQLDEHEGLFYGLRDQGHFLLPYPAKDIFIHELAAPQTTRAAVRGACVEKFGEAVEAAQWDMIKINTEDSRTVQIDLRDLFAQGDIRLALSAIESAAKPQDLTRMPEAKLV